jgi:N-acetyl-anhydromuramyl-L-alanine amidase AmpD
LGRKKKIKALILHRTFGDLQKTVRWCFNLGSQESFHFLISREGQVIQLIKCQDTAWHCGFITNSQAPSFLSPNPNFSSLGIACEDEGSLKECSLTSAQIRSLGELIRDISAEINLPLTAENIMSHGAVDPLRNPKDHFSPLDWEKIIKQAGFLDQNPSPAKKKSKENIFVIENLITKLFRGILGRDPNISELDYYKYSGLDIAQISRRLTQAEEFQNNKNIIKNKE